MFPVVGAVGALLGPIVYEQRHIPADLRSLPSAPTPSVERDLSCAVEATCGPLRGPATLTLGAAGAAPTVEPVEALPPGYAECAARVLGDTISGALRLAPCETAPR